MSKLNVINRSRRMISSALWIAVATCVLLGLNAATASAQAQLIEICHKGKTLKVNYHAIPALLEQGARIGSCDTPAPCACSIEFDPVTCNGKLYANECLAVCAGEVSGDCARVRVCSNIYNPVTCTAPDGSTQTYANACQAANAGATNCGTLCACPVLWAPVRCSDGTIYANECIAQCRGASGCTPLALTPTPHR